MPSDSVLGSACFIVSIGAKRSPFSWARLMTVSGLNRQAVISRLSRSSARPSQITGVQTKGWSLSARNE